MRNLQTLLFALFLFAGLSACDKTAENTGNGPQQEKKYDYTMPAIGVILPDETVRKDTTESYTLYVPKAYSPDRQWPLVLFLDPHADGRLPVEKYQSLADKYGFIIAGSNRSQNRENLELLKHHYLVVSEDIKARLNIHPRGTILAGFSGAGKVAIVLSNIYPEIAGVISCSGPDNFNPRRHTENFTAYIISGNLDFNFGSTKSMEYGNRRIPFDQYYAYLKMKHEWPALPDMDDAFRWMYIKGMRSGAVAKDDVFLDSLFAAWEKEYKDKSKFPDGRPRPLSRDQYESLRKLVSHFQGLRPVEKYRKDDSMFTSNEELRKLEKDVIEAIRKEEQTYDNFTNGFNVWTLEEWKKEINRIKSQADAKAGTVEGDMYGRIYAMLGMNLFSMGHMAVEQSAFEDLDKILQIYQLVEPANPEHRYLAARGAARRHLDNQVKTELESAIRLGFSDKTQLLKEPDFLPYHNAEWWQPLVEMIK